MALKRTIVSLVAIALSLTVGLAYGAQYDCYPLRSCLTSTVEEYS